jgi:hypothetical protein
MAITYEPIETTTLSSAVSSFSFTSIPGTYTDLVLICSKLVENTNGQGYIRFNSDSGSNYSRTVVYGTGSSAASFRQTNQVGLNVGMAANGTFIKMNIMNYSSSTTNKTVIDREDDPSGATVGTAFLWRNTAAITSISILSLDGSASLQAGVIFTLYGIKAA